MPASESIRPNPKGPWGLRPPAALLVFLALAAAAAPALGCSTGPPGSTSGRAAPGATGSGRQSPAEPPEVPSAAAGLALLRQGDLRGAEPHLAGALREAPRDPRLLEALGSIYARTDRFREAERTFAAALESDPGSAGARLGLAAVLIDTGRYDEARHRLQEVRRADPANLAALLKLALLETRRGRAVAGEEMARAVIARRPDSAEAHYVLGLALAQRGALAGAAEAQRRAQRLAPDHLGALAQLMTIESRLGRDAEARRWAEAHREALRRRRVEERVRGHRLKGVEAFNREDYASALQEFLAIAREDPDDPQVYLHLGTTYMALGRLAEARRAIEHSLSLDPRGDRALTELGRLLALENRLAEAVEALRRAVSANPQAAEPHHYLAGIHMARGELVEAERERAIYETLRAPGGPPVEPAPGSAPKGLP